MTLFRRCYNPLINLRYFYVKSEQQLPKKSVSYKTLTNCTLREHRTFMTFSRVFSNKNDGTYGDLPLSYNPKKEVINAQSSEYLSKSQNDKNQDKDYLKLDDEATHSEPKKLITLFSEKNYHPPLKAKLVQLEDNINEWYKFYEDTTGISEVRRSQDRVTKLIDTMSDLSMKRITMQDELAALHLDLNNVHSHITNSPRYSDEHTLLFEQARQLNHSLLTKKREFELLEIRERDCLNRVMSSIRVSHQMERNQQHNTSYRTVTLSIISAAIASAITFITNLKRTKDTNLRIEKTEDHASALHEKSQNELKQMRDQIDSIGEQIFKAIGSISNSLGRKPEVPQHYPSFSFWPFVSWESSNLDYSKLFTYSSIATVFGFLVYFVVL